MASRASPREVTWWSASAHSIRRGLAIAEVYSDSMHGTRPDSVPCDPVPFRHHAAFRGILTEIIAHDRKEFSSPIDRGQLNGDPVRKIRYW